MAKSRRDTILQDILPEVVPSSYPDAKFKRIDASWAPGSGYTTCGGLPGFVARALKVPPHCERDGITGSGLASMRNAGITRSAWVHHDMTLRRLAGGMGMVDQLRLPRPGDFYMLCSGDRHDTGCNCIAPIEKKDWHKYRGGQIEHVGVIVSVNGKNWKTADAGQPNGNVQCARYVDRTFDPATGFMTGELTRAGKPMRRLCGWLDVDAYPFLDAYVPGAR